MLNSVSDVALFAEKGGATASGVGIGKDLYREALAAVGSAISNAFGGGDVSFETRTGNSVKTQTSGVTVNGEIHVGTHRKQNLEIDINGNVVAKTDGISIANTGVASLAQDILDRIDALNQLIREYSGGSAGSDAAIAVAAYQSEIRFLERKLVELGFQPDPLGGGFAGVAGLSPKEAAQEAVTAMTATKAGLTTTKTDLTTANTGLTTTNTNLTTANTNLSSQNATLQTEVTALIAQRDALDADDTAGRQAIQNQINAKNTTINNNNNTINANTSTIEANTDTIEANTTEIGLLTTRITSLDGRSSMCRPTSPTTCTATWPPLVQRRSS
ncbi:Spc7 kinetochore protein [Hydrogenophaga sp. T4]|nr:Spc7 kinetochore protein [Hydrogenophaga sp. T4]